MFLTLSNICFAVVASNAEATTQPNNKIKRKYQALLRLKKHWIAVVECFLSLSNARSFFLYIYIYLF